ncbi:hypothetical protein MNBD_GAMMA10-1238 [hydrothermal vent metagenome]|uniref:DUF4129 domain-containing protein n=1 Tax=hydrothermal vent metagenome TaxID=652676 RepID=A0A3B0XE94_9ZZZZ
MSLQGRIQKVTIMFNMFSPILLLLLSQTISANTISANAISASAMSGEEDVKTTEETDWVPALNDERVDIDESKTVITKIKSSEPFINIQKTKKLVSVKDENEEEEKDPDETADVDLLKVIFGFFALLIEGIFWMVPVLIVFLLYYYREHWLHLIQGTRRQRKDEALPDTLFGLDLRRQSLPDDIEQAAHLLWQQKKCREAVSLLYRASLSALFGQYKFELSRGATEQDCLRLLEISERRLKTTTDADSRQLENMTHQVLHFKQLTQVWISLAYAHRLPNEATFDQVCGHWNLHFSHGPVSTGNEE